MMNEHIQDTVKELFESLGITLKSVNEHELAGQSIINIDIEGQIDPLLGKDADTLRSFDYLVKKIVEQKSGGETAERPLYLVDINKFVKT